MKLSEAYEYDLFEYDLLKFVPQHESLEARMIGVSTMRMVEVIEKINRQFYVQHRETMEITAIAPQQFNCFKLLLKGQSIKEIGRALSLSPRTVEAYLKGLRKTVGCKNGKELVAKFSIETK